MQRNQPCQRLRMATRNDLDAINQVVEAAVMTWQLPERVKRLALPSYHYNKHDLEHYEFVVAESGNQIIGIAAWDTAPHQGPGQTRLLLLHGIYVMPEQQHRGIGRRLFAAAEAAAGTRTMDGVLVRAQKDAEGFFRAQGLEKLAARDPARDYENRYWKRLE
jgi:N-acetylglutamate synthase-like GNAT family acetyltransferase